MTEYTIFLVWDNEAGVWFSDSEDIPGLILQSNSVETLIERLKIAAPEFLELSNMPSHNIKLNFKAERQAVFA
jgi:predicted RNase H-like HicB family nuclease